MKKDKDFTSLDSFEYEKEFLRVINKFVVYQESFLELLANIDEIQCFLVEKGNHETHEILQFQLARDGGYRSMLPFTLPYLLGNN